MFFGGLAIAKDEQVIKSNCPNIIVGTPGRILALVRSKKLNLKNLKHFILDECYKMLEQLGMYLIFPYSRIVWDIFPPVCDDWNDHKLIRLVLFNDKETKKVISSWGRKQQNCLTLTNELGKPILVSKFHH